MKLLVILFSFLLLTNGGFSQNIIRIEISDTHVMKMFKETKLDALSNLFKEYGINPLKDDVRWDEVYREICPGYSEGIVKIEKRIDTPDSTGFTGTRTYILNVLSNEANPIYYELNSSDNMFSSGMDRSEHQHALNRFKDSARCELFKASFENIYGVPLHAEDMFLTIRFARGCGFAGSPPTELEELNDFLRKNDVRSVRSWLRSVNAEKQLYALQGFCYLQQNGHKISADDQRIIRLIQGKKGSIYTCHGCSPDKASIGTAIREMESNPPVLLERHERDSTPPHGPGSPDLRIFVQILSIFVTVLLAVILFRKWPQRKAAIARINANATDISGN